MLEILTLLKPRRSQALTIEAASTALLIDGDVDAIRKFFTADYVVHFTEQDIAGGHDLIKKVLGTYRRAFSEIEVDVEILVKGKNRIAWQRTMKAIHTGAFKGFPATRRPIAWRDMMTTEFRGGQIAEEWMITDLAERLLLARKR